MEHQISVVVCTHNPRPAYLVEVLSALQAQTLSFESWELLIIDNASEQPLGTTIDLSWHPHSRHIYEEKLGLTSARLKGISEANADVLVFVDDDNVLDKDYLSYTLEIAKTWPMLGAWGGQTIPRFEVAPPEWTKPYWSLIGIREFACDRWSNLLDWQACPIGAGLCVRKQVAQRYAERVIHDPLRLGLGRMGNLLSGSEDVDLAYTSTECNLGTGLFTSLKLTHLIPAFRVQEDYLLRLAEGTYYSMIITDFLWGKLPSMTTWKKRLRLKFPWLLNPQVLFVNKQERQFSRAMTRGRVAAMKKVLEIEQAALTSPFN